MRVRGYLQLGVLLFSFANLAVANQSQLGEKKDGRRVRGKPEVRVDARAEAETALAAGHCLELTKQLIDGWGATREWRRRPTDLDGGRVFASPTAKIGVWVQVTSFPDGSIEAFRFSPDATLRVNWRASDCTPRLQPRIREAQVEVKGTTYLRDSNLEELAGQGGAVFIYAWSPHMPLSVRGFAEARALCEKLSIKFLPVLDPEADDSLARSVAEAKHLPIEALVRADSLELTVRGVHQHYPSSLVLSKGKFSGLYPGLWTSKAALTSFVKAAIK